MQYALYLLAVTDPPPSDNNVRAGWGALGVMLLLIAAVAFLCWSFTRQLRKVKAAREAGVYDDADRASPRAETSTTDRGPHEH
jgi:hypothetical protein